MWQPSQGACGAWYWFNCVDATWTAGIVDDSQVGHPPQRTHYRIFASSRDRLFEVDNVAYLTFDFAKDAALDFTLRVRALNPVEKNGVITFPG